MFARIVERPAERFFVIQDELLRDELVLYSPGMQASCETGHADSLYLLLLGFNGRCWQSYGLIASFKSFDIHDVYVFATEVFSSVEDDQTFMQAVYKDSIPFFMLMVGQETPHMMSGEHYLEHCVAEQEIGPIDPTNLEQEFQVEWNDGVFRLQLEDWKGGPHFAAAYYIQERQELFRYAMTRAGFDALTSKLIGMGWAIGREADYCVSLSMASSFSRVLRRDLVVNEWDRKFTTANEQAMPEEAMNDLNVFISDLMPYINSSETPDLEMLASRHAVDLQTAKDLYAHFKRLVSRG